MAEEVIIKFDIGVAANNIARLEAELKKVKQEYKAAEIGSKEFYKAQDAGKQLTEQIKKQNDALKANTNALNGVNTAAKFGKDSYGALKQSIKATKDELLKLDVGSDEFIKTQKELVVLEQKRIDVEKQIPSLFQERIKGAIDEANTLQGLRAEIKKYTAAVIAGEEGAAEKLAELKDKLNDVKDATSTFAGSGVERLNSSMSKLTESLVNFDGDKFKVAMEGIGGAMKAIPIFLIIEGIKLLVENFDKVYKFFQMFTDEAQAVKAATKSFEALKISIDRQVTAIEGQIKVQEAELGLMEAQHKSNSEILAQEKDIFKSKLDLIKAKALEAKESALLNITKQKEILANDSVYEATLRIAKQTTNIKAQQEQYDKLIEDSKKERAKEFREQQETDTKTLMTLSSDLTSLLIQNETKLTTNATEEREKRIDSARKLRQAEIDNIQDNYKRALAQSEFDKKVAEENLKRDFNFRGDKAKLKAEIEKKAMFETIAIAKEEAIRLESIANELSQYKIDLIINDFKRSQEQIKLNEQIALQNAENTIINNAALLEETKRNIAAKYAEENRKLALDYVQKDLLAAQQLILENQEYNLNEQFEARKEILELQRQDELVNFEGTENEKLLIIKKYKDAEILLFEEQAKKKAEIRNMEIEFSKNLALTLTNIATLFAKGQEQQSAIAKAAALINIAANTATAISNLTAVSFSPASPDNIATGGLAAYVKLATGILAITSNMAQAKQVISSFEEGGYTGDGATNEVSTNLGSKPYTYHKSEYVIPARVLSTPQGNMLASQAESMRLGMSNPMPYIGGMFDGGFTARSAGQEANNAISNNSMIQQLIANLPTPVVRVTDINKVQSDSARVIQATSL